MAGEGDAAALEPRPSARGEEGCAGGGMCAGPASGRRGTGRCPGLFAGRFGVSVAGTGGALSENMPGGAGGGAVGRTHARVVSWRTRTPFHSRVFPLVLPRCCKRGRGERLCDLFYYV